MSTEATEGRLGADREASLRSLVKRADHGSATDAVTDALREAILTGILAPHTWLREGELGEVLSVSRTPVREALRRLSDEGLTQRVANRGTVVAPMSFEDILAVYTVRANLEGLAARTAAALRPAGMVDRLLAIHEEMETAVNDGREQDLPAINLRFHRVIREASHNAYLERFLLQIENAVRRFGKTTFKEEGRTEQVLKEHHAIIEAIANGDGDSAEELARTHMRNAREVRVRQMIGPRS